MTANLVGQTIGNYRIERLLGAGGMGQVYQAMHTMLNRPAAIKIMHEQMASDKSFQARFLQEAKAAAALSHPNITQIYDFGEQRGRLYLVMELIEGGSLRDYLQRSGQSGKPMPVADLVEIVRQAAEALAYAHSKGMVHRDVKPDNMLMASIPGDGGRSNPWTVKITDFGLARLAEGGIATMAGVTMGTPAYMSPEHAQGLELDGRSDIYSLGVVLYELATGFVPFNATTLSEAVTKHVHAQPSPPRQSRPDLPVAIEQIIMRCLAKNPAERFATGTDLATALRNAAGGNAGAGFGTLLGGSSGPAGATQMGGQWPPTGGAPAGGSSPGPVAGSGTIMNPLQVGASPPVSPTLLGATNIPRVHVMSQNGAVEGTYDLTNSGLTLGRQAGNDIVLSGNDVSRQHLRIDWDGQQVTVTDLGSSNGTSIGDARLLPRVSQVWSPRDWVRAGPHWLRLQAPNEPDTRPMTPPVGGQTQFRTTASDLGGAQRIRLMLDQERLTITPGQPSLVRATIANMGTTVDHIKITVDGVPAEWVTTPPQDSQLIPGAQAPVMLNVNVPRVPESRAGEYPVSIRARSRENPADSTAVPATWTVLSFEASSAEIDPIKRSALQKANYKLQLHNRGNAPATYALSAKDEEQVLNYRFRPEEVPLGPGQSTTAALTVEMPRRWVGSSQNRPFTVQSTPIPSGTPQVIPAQFVHRALIPPWLPPVVLAALAGLFLLIRSILATDPVTPVIESISVDPLSPVIGQPFVVSWKVINADSVEIRPIASGLNPDTGQYIVANGLPANVPLTLIASNKDGSEERPIPLALVMPTPTPTPEPGAPVIELWEITPRIVQLGEPVTIRWRVSDAETVDVDPFGTVDLEGERTETPQQTIRYTLTVSNQGKTVRRSEEVIVVQPTPTPFPTTGGGGGGGGGNGGGTATSTMGGGGGGMETMTPTTGMTPTTTVTATTAPSPEFSLWADAMTIDPYECTNIHWTFEYVESLTLDDEPVEFEGSREVCPTATQTYFWDVVDLNGDQWQYQITIEVNPWQQAHFAGNWINVNPNGGTSRLIIQPFEDSSFFVPQPSLRIHGFGRCTPTDCDWGEVDVPFTDSPVVATYEFGFKRQTLTITREKDELKVEIFHDYTPADGRQDRREEEVLKLDTSINNNPEIYQTPTTP